MLLRKPMSRPKLKPGSPPRYKQNVTATLTCSVTWVLICYRQTTHSGPSLNKRKRDWVEIHGIKKLVNRENTNNLQDNSKLLSVLIIIHYNTFRPSWPSSGKYKIFGIVYYIKKQQDPTLAVLFISNCKIILHVSHAFCAHHQEY